MKRANLVEFGRIVIEDVEMPPPGPGEVRIAVKVCGVCGSDTHAFQGLHPFIEAPIVLGHEFAGHIDALGQGVSGLSVGQRVTVEPSLVCGKCDMCREGRYNICDHLRVLGCQADGAMGEMVDVPATKVVPIPHGMSYESAALVEPTAVSVHALRRVDPNRVRRLLIIGAGPIGLQTLQMARVRRVPTIVVTDVVEGKLAKAGELGATHTVNVGRDSLADFFVQEFGRPNPADLVMECVGTQDTLLQSIESVKRGGRIVIVGVPPTDPRIRLSWIQDRELEIFGTLMYTRRDFEEARNLIASGRVQTDSLITARYPLERIGAAMDELVAHPEKNIKVLISIAP